MSALKKKTEKTTTPAKDRRAEKLYELVRPAISKQSFRRPGSAWGKMLEEMDRIMEG